jgi:uncharacterized protein (DUF1778 family)
MKDAAIARFDARISVKQKSFFEYAAALSGYKTLAAFIFHAAEVEAEKIIERHNAILQSEKDKEVFFDVIMNPPKPNASLKKAAKRHAEILKNKQ